MASYINLLRSVAPCSEARIKHESAPELRGRKKQYGLSRAHANLQAQATMRSKEHDKITVCYVAPRLNPIGPTSLNA